MNAEDQDQRRVFDQLDAFTTPPSLHKALPASEVRRRGVRRRRRIRTVQAVGMVAASALIVTPVYLSTSGSTRPGDHGSDIAASPTRTWTTTIRPGFPLAAGLPSAPAAPGFGITGPTRTLDLSRYNLDSALTACGHTPAGQPKASDTLYAAYDSPADSTLRILTTYPTPTTAQAYTDAVLAPFTRCTAEDAGGGLTKTYTLHQPTTPGAGVDFASAAVMEIRDNSRPGIGYQLVETVRVGNKVLLTVLENDTQALDNNNRLVTTTRATDAPVIQAMQ